MAQDKNTAGYTLHVTIELVEVNRYGDHIGDGSLTMTKTLRARNMTELGVVLARIDELGE